MSSEAGSRRAHSPGCSHQTDSAGGSVEPGPGLDVAGIRENLQLLIDLSSQLPSRAILSPQDSDIFRDSCSTIEKVLTAQRERYDENIPHQSSGGVESIKVTVPPKGAEESKTADSAEAEAPQNDRELLSILDSLTKANEGFRQRRIEQRQIHDQYHTRCERLSKRISELEDEVNSLQCEMFNNTIELECMRGTVSGLDSWFNHWKSQNDSDDYLDSALKRPSKSRGKYSKYFDQLGRLEEQRDGLIDGLSAWMRGWNDANDGFRTRPVNLNQS
ncbi:hypothetical protein FQN49_003063 [Arthroderma sp. PD_2]|nr:hypothetical protein FQN49_003063 [Arthroderma sp. PD_2]